MSRTRNSNQKLHGYLALRLIFITSSSSQRNVISVLKPKSCCGVMQQAYRVPSIVLRVERTSSPQDKHDVNRVNQDDKKKREKKNRVSDETKEHKNRIGCG